jgi:hypothetical protein
MFFVCDWRSHRRLRGDTLWDKVNAASKSKRHSRTQARASRQAERFTPLLNALLTDIPRSNETISCLAPQFRLRS